MSRRAKSKRKYRTMLRRRARRSAVTRKFYQWEGQWPGLDHKDRPIRFLRSLGERIWRENTGRRDRCPEIVAGDGFCQNGRRVSYCLGRCRIVLARHERSKAILIHEMVHALGPETHGRRFQERYADILDRYG